MGQKALARLSNPAVFNVCLFIEETNLELEIATINYLKK
jgi:hypothetical protein